MDDREVILIADDIACSKALVSRLLGKSCRIKTAASGAEALALLELDEPRRGNSSRERPVYRA